MDTSDKVDMPKGHWKFDDKVAAVFDDHVRQSVPMYDEIHRMVADISCWFISPNTNVYDIGTSTGEALYNIANLHDGKGVTFFGFDTSVDMVKKASERFVRTDVRITRTDIANPSVELRNASYVTSILTAQFIDPNRRQDVIQKIYDGLNIGGAFVLVEKVIGSTPRFDQMYVELYHELKLNNGLSMEHVFQKSRSLRGVQRPCTIEENRDMLHRAGFKDVDIFFKWANFTAFLATK